MPNFEPVNQRVMCLGLFSSECSQKLMVVERGEVISNISYSKMVVFINFLSGFFYSGFTGCSGFFGDLSL